MAPYFVYVLTCADGTLYVGVTTDPARRLAQHNRGKGAKYTRGRTPVRISYLEPARSRSLAQKREAAIKRSSKRAKLLLVGRSGRLSKHSSR